MENKSSYEKINYSLRPAKNIERKMLCETLQRLSLIQKLEKYRYVGFGSTYFSDFNLMHRLLGINKMISIEKDIKNQDRFEFNKPFSCVDIKFGTSNEVLPSLDWSVPSIVWVDYDSKLCNEMLEDINTIVYNIKAGSVFLLSIDVKPDRLKDESLTPNLIKELRLNDLKKRINHLKVPAEFDDINLDYIENPKLIYRIANNQISEILNQRNGGYLKKDKLQYKQLFHFLYDDGTLMLTVGGIIFNSKQKQYVDAMGLNSLEYIKEGDEPFFIHIPKLTYKEIYTLDSLLPHHINTKTGKIDAKGKGKNNIPKLSADDVKKYSKIYRYFPNFAEASF